MIIYAGDHQAAILRPGKHVKVQTRTSFNCFLGTTSPGQMFERAGLGPVNRFAIGFHPLAHGRKTVNTGLRKKTFSGRSNIEQKVAPLRSNISQLLDQILAGLPVIIVLVVAPVVIHRHAGFPINTRKTCGWNFLFRGTEITGIITLFG